MEVTIKILFHFFMILSLGMVVHLPFVNIKETGIGFFRLVYAIAGTSLLCALSLSFTSFVTVKTWNIIVFSVWLLSLAVSYVVLGHWDIIKAKKLTKLLALIELSVLGAYLLGYSFFHASFLFVTIFYFGSITFAMILGHYYLVVPRLSEKPLLNLHIEFWVFLIFKIILISYVFSVENINFGLREMYDSIMLAMRVLWGPVAIFCLSIFSFKLSKMRSTQSATGVLYVETFFMISSELIALYFFIVKGWTL